MVSVGVKDHVYLNSFQTNATRQATQAGLHAVVDQGTAVKQLLQTVLATMLSTLQ